MGFPRLLAILSVFLALTFGSFAQTNKPTKKQPIAPGKAAKVNRKDGLTYVWIPPGTFQMGCYLDDHTCDNDEKPAHTVTITNGFWMGQTLVTQEAYQRVSPFSISDSLPVTSNSSFPAVCVRPAGAFVVPDACGAEHLLQLPVNWHMPW